MTIIKPSVGRSCAGRLQLQLVARAVFTEFPVARRFVITSLKGRGSPPINEVHGPMVTKVSYAPWRYYTAVYYIQEHGPMVTEVSYARWRYCTTVYYIKIF